MHPLLILSQKDNSELINELKDLVSQERHVLAQVLRYLREVESRKLYLENGYPSLFEFARQELGYSESAAGRRIQAMRLLKDLPEVEKKIEQGSISLSVASQAQSFFRKEDSRRRECKAPKLPVKEKLSLVNQLEGSSARECERKLAQLSPESARPRERTRIIDAEITLVQFSAGSKLMKKIERLKELTSHTNPEGKYEKLFENAIDTLLSKIDPIKREDRRVKRKSSAPLPPPCTVRYRATSGVVKVNRHIPQALRDKIWVRDRGKCQYRDRNTGRLCNSGHHLQIDHRYPFALGGEHTLKNLRLLCSSHNRFLAKEVLG